jgi:arylsulfatase A-like enzyme/tetratricopeptide (TPR) repeat protein
LIEKKHFLIVLRDIMWKIVTIATLAGAVLIAFVFLGGRTHPNLLLISVDTLRPDHLGCYGDAGIETPAIDGLAAEGVRFTNVRSAVPLTLPSHATILTGLYPPSHGIRDNGFTGLAPRIKTLAQTLKGQGYSTIAVVGSFVLDSRYGLDRGFDVYDDDLAGGRKTLEFSYAEIGADEVTRKATALLDETGEPFFAFVHYYDPHLTYDPPEPYATTYAGRLYDGEIAYTDQAIGRLIGFLREKGRLERTLVVLVSDHGEGLGEHGEPTHGVFVYDATLKVPMIIRPPEGSKAAGPLVPGTTVDLPVGLVDVHDSVLDLLGIGRDGATEGESVLERMRSGTEGSRLYYFESLYPRLAFRWSPLKGVISGGWKYILAPEQELYNVVADPGEAANLAGGEPGKVADLREQLVGLAERLEEGGARQAPGPSPEEAARLRSLGYLGGGGAIPAPLDTSGLDPKRIMGEFAPLMGDGEDALTAGDLEAAFTSFRRIVEFDPGNPQARVFLATTLMRMGRLEEAAAEYRLVAGLDSTNSTAFFQLGNISQMGGNPQEALGYYRHALELEPGSPEALAGMGGVMMEMGHADSAEALLTRALEGNPRNSAAILNLGLLYQARGDYDDAVAFFQRTLDINPRSVKALANISVVYAAKGCIDSTVKYLEAARRIEPTNASILSNLGNAYRQTGRIDEASECYHEALAADPSSVMALFGLAAVSAGRGNTAEARNLLRHILEVDPSFQPARAALEKLGGP